MSDSIMLPDWPAPAGVNAAFTTRKNGFSEGPWSSFNLGSHVGDDGGVVSANRQKLISELALKAAPVWLEQVHGTDVLCLDNTVHRGSPQPPLRCDAAYTRKTHLPCVVMTADCLPVLFCDRNATVVAAAHAGWRGLAGGILTSTVLAMGVAPTDIMAFFGPAISQPYFEVGPEVKAVFVENSPSHVREDRASCFIPSPNPGKFMADLYQLARLELHALGVDAVYGGDRCTYGEAESFYSFRRDGVTGRMATLIWLA